MVTQQDIIEFQINEARRKLNAVYNRSKGKITAAGKQAATELMTLLAQAQKGSNLSAQGIQNTYAAERAGGRAENTSLAADLAAQGGNTSVLQAMAAQQDTALGAQGNRTGAYQSDLDTLMSGIVADRKAASDATTLATQQELDANLAEQQAALNAQRQLALMQLAGQGGGGGGGRGGGGRRGGGGGGGSSGAVKPVTASELRQLNEAFTSSQMKAPDIDKLAAQFVYGPLDKSLSADPALAALAKGENVVNTGRGFAPTGGQETGIQRNAIAMRLRADEQRNMNDVLRRIAAGDKPEDIVRGWNITEARDKPQWNVGDIDTFLENWQRQRAFYDDWAAKAPTRGEFLKARIAEYYAQQGVDVTDEELHPTEHRLWKEAGDKFLSDKEAKRRAVALAKVNAPKIAAAARAKSEMNYRHNIDIMSRLGPEQGIRNLGQTSILDFSKSGIKPPGLQTTLEAGYGSGSHVYMPPIQMPKPAPFVLPPGASNTVQGPAPAPVDISHAAPPASIDDILNWYAALDAGKPGAAGARRAYRMGGGRGYT